MSCLLVIWLYLVYQIVSGSLVGVGGNYARTVATLLTPEICKKVTYMPLELFIILKL